MDVTLLHFLLFLGSKYEYTLSLAWTRQTRATRGDYGKARQKEPGSLNGSMEESLLPACTQAVLSEKNKLLSFGPLHLRNLYYKNLIFHHNELFIRTACPPAIQTFLYLSHYL